MAEDITIINEGFTFSTPRTESHIGKYAKELNQIKKAHIRKKRMLNILLISFLISTLILCKVFDAISESSFAALLGFILGYVLAIFKQIL